MAQATRLSDVADRRARNVPAVGVFVPGDPRIDAASRERCGNIARMVAEVLAERLTMPDGSPARVVYSPILVDGETQADVVAKQFQDEGVKVLVCAPDTWACQALGELRLGPPNPAIWARPNCLVSS